MHRIVLDVLRRGDGLRVQRLWIQRCRVQGRRGRGPRVQGRGRGLEGCCRVGFGVVAFVLGAPTLFALQAVVLAFLRGALVRWA
jgi:hypothetical protein